MISNNKGHPNLTPLCLAERPLVSDTANIVQAEWRKKELVHFFIILELIGVIISLFFASIAIFALKFASFFSSCNLEK